MSLAQPAVGGGYVRRRFTAGGETYFAGDHLTADDIKGLGNRHVLVGSGYIETYPLAPAGAGERHAFHVGGGKHVVVAGTLLTDEPVSKVEADALVAAQR